MQNYAPLETIGSGSFGIIRKVQRKSDGKIMARKEIDYRKMTEKEKRQLVAEVNILRELRHPNIVRYYERYVDRDNCIIYILMEFCEGGDLAAVIRRCKKEMKRIPEDVIWNLVTQLLQALHECHQGGGKTGGRPTILHRDIKPDNVFLDGNNNVKLGDFGLSKIIENPETEFAKTYVGTPFYMSPELVIESCYNAKSDIWALGCLIYELCALEPPFQAKTQAALATKIRQGRVASLPPMYSAELNNLIRFMLQTEHTKRPGTQEILKHDRIRLVAKERELKEIQLDLRRREEDIRKKEEELRKRELLLQAREAASMAREEAVRPMQTEVVLLQERRPLAECRNSSNIIGNLQDTHAILVSSLPDNPITIPPFNILQRDGTSLEVAPSKHSSANNLEIRHVLPSTLVKNYVKGKSPSPGL